MEQCKEILGEWKRLGKTPTVLHASRGHTSRSVRKVC